MPSPYTSVVVDTDQVADDPEDLNTDQWYRITVITNNGDTVEGYVPRTSKSAARSSSSTQNRTVRCPMELVEDIVSDYEDLDTVGWEAVVSDDHRNCVAGPIGGANADDETITIYDETDNGGSWP